MELSIVLVILGLLVGGILAGKSLIRAAELRSVSTQHQGYVTAVRSFRDKYFALSGDMNNATSFWGRADTGATSGQCAAPASDVGTGAQTCNGSGDGLVADGTYEQWRFWQHLANAGLIEGQYTGVEGAGGAFHSIPGTNAPKGRLSNSGWHVNYFSQATDAANGADYAQPGSHRMIFGTIMTNERPRAPIFTAAEAWSIDTKLDDGKNGIGNIVSWIPGIHPGCGTTASSTTSVYDVSGTSIACALIFRGAF